ncbi:rCG56976, isoform CRA_b [Rattus norvegicus]|uniref:RCG56976, isoform CRA_b n=1 Tax=Rattus norvegicus TaxID=10116 RepID=A6JD52_RAT|nr:rCG56976, isoform CRA_b [Rattus norvegicus]
MLRRQRSEKNVSTVSQAQGTTAPAPQMRVNRI